MRATEKLRNEGQSLWLDNITRKMLDSGQISRYAEQYSVTGLTSNPSIFDKAIESGDYDAEIRDKARPNRADEAQSQEHELGRHLDRVARGHERPAPPLHAP